MKGRTPPFASGGSSARQANHIPDADTASKTIATIQFVRSRMDGPLSQEIVDEQRSGHSTARKRSESV
jgi:hypothetical protein